MRTSLRVLLVSAVAALSVSMTLPASAASLRHATKVQSTASTSSTSGYDISYPQCGTSLPSGQAFGIAGVNGGLATKPNNCLATELSWAWGSTGTVAAQPKAQLYVNTANPGQVRDQVTTWPTSGSTPYGACTTGPDGYGNDDQACSWEYGYQRAENDVTTFFTPAAGQAGVDADPGHYLWWLDVETGNTWETGTATSQADNQAALEGMTAYFQGVFAHVGIYSTNTQWNTIAGQVPPTSSLDTLPSWMAGARTVRGAKSNCSNPPLTPDGHVVLSQYVSSGLDHDVSCG